MTAIISNIVRGIWLTTLNKEPGHKRSKNVWIQEKSKPRQHIVPTEREYIYVWLEIGHVLSVERIFKKIQEHNGIC